LLLLIGVLTLALVAAFAFTGHPDKGPVPLPAASSATPPVPAAVAAEDIVLGNARLEVRVGTTGARTGALTFVDRISGSTMGENLGFALVFPAGVEYRVPGDAQIAGETEISAVQTILGPGRQLRVPFMSADGKLEITLYAVLPDEGDSAFLQVAVRSFDDQLPADSIVYVRLPDSESGRFDAGDGTVFLSDATAVLSHELYDDGSFQELIGLGSPVYVAGPGGRAVVMSWLDEPTQWPLFSLQRAEPDVHIGFETGLLGRLADRAPFVDVDGSVWSPRLLFDLADRDTRVAFEDYKRAMAVLYPQPPLPDWFGPQWDSYWVYDLEINEENTLANANAIDRYFSDLGPWSLIFDAGWYLDSGVPGSAPDVVNTEKFPTGLAPVISYLKSRGIHSVLYFSAPYVDRRVAVDPSSFTGPPAWMALAGFIERYPDLVTSLTADGDGPSYVYNFLNPGMRDYLDYLMRLYLEDFGGDGILLDLVGEASPAIADVAEGDRAPGGRVPLVARQSLAVYQAVWEAATAAKPDALVEGSWMNPVLSRSYAQTWRLADEVPAFSFVYPYNGLLQKVDYAVLQEEMLGVRPHIGYLRGPGTAPYIQRWWMGAALALGAEFAIAVDFTQLTPETAEVYRAYLAHYKPFTGFTFFGPGGLQPNWFATTRDGVTYLGLINREDQDREFTVPLSELGLDNGRQVIAYDPDQDEASFVNGKLTVDMLAGSFRLIILRDTPGPVWGTRRTSESTDGGVTTIDVEASPLESGGTVMVYAPASRIEVDSPGYSIDTEEAQFQRISLRTGEATQVRIVPALP